MNDPVVDGPVWIPSLPPSFEQFIAFNPQPIPVLPAIAIILATAYLAGAIRLWGQGRRWSRIRTGCFLLGCILLFSITGLGVEGYGLRMFSVFMFQQLSLMVVIAPLLVLGSPGTLLLRSTPHRGLGGAVLRTALCGLRSRAASMLLHPALVVPLMLLSFFGLYLSGAADRLLRTWAGHTGLEILFLAIGILIATPLVSSDPLPRQTSYVSRAFDAFVELQVHLAFGLVLTLAAAPLVSFFADTPSGWGIDPIFDQWLAGVFALTYGELPLLIILIIALERWQRRDTRRAVKDESLHEAELDAYNEYLNQLRTGGRNDAE